MKELNEKEKQFQNKLNNFLLDSNVKIIMDKLGLLPLWSLSLGSIAYFVQDWWWSKKRRGRNDDIKIGIWKKIGIVACGAILGLQLGIIQIRRTMKRIDPQETIVMQVKDLANDLRELKRERQEEKFF